MRIGARVRSSRSKTHNLEKGEFLFSKTETEKFGLKKSQQGQLERIISDLIRMGIIEKTDKRTGIAHSIVYRFINNDFLDCSRERASESANKRSRRSRETNRKQSGTKNDKNGKNGKNEHNRNYYEEAKRRNPEHMDFPLWNPDDFPDLDNPNPGKS